MKFDIERIKIFTSEAALCSDAELGVLDFTIEFEVQLENSTEDLITLLFDTNLDGKDMFVWNYDILINKYGDEIKPILEELRVLALRYCDRWVSDERSRL